MPPTVLVDLGFKPFRHPRHGALISHVADQAGHASAAAIAAVRAFPRPSWMVLTNPSGVRTEDAFHRSHPAQR
jgi:hypothetical protein